MDEMAVAVAVVVVVVQKSNQNYALVVAKLGPVNYALVETNYTSVAASNLKYSYN